MERESGFGGVDPHAYFIAEVRVGWDEAVGGIVFFAEVSGRGCISGVMACRVVANGFEGCQGL